MNVFMVAVEVAAAVTTGEIDIVGILKHIGGTAVDLANAICDKPVSIFEMTAMGNHFENDHEQIIDGDFEGYLARITNNASNDNTGNEHVHS